MDYLLKCLYYDKKVSGHVFVCFIGFYDFIIGF